MSHPVRSRLTRFARSLAVVGLLLGPVALAGPVGAVIPHGSRGQIILETRDVTGQPWNASLAGWWGHEGAKNDTGKRPTFPSLDLSDGHGVVDDATTAAVHKALGDGGDFSTLRVAFVPYSADGSNERPLVHKGENAGQAFAWFADLGVGTALNGTTNRDEVIAWISTLTEYTKWWNAGRPVQALGKNRQVFDIASDGSTHPSTTPQGMSILNRWPAGTKISLVFYVSDGVDPAMPQVPTVKVGKDGRAETAWMTFETVGSPTDPARTSAGYKVLTGAGTGPGVAARPKDAPTAAATPTPTAPTTPAATPASSSSTKHGFSGFTSSFPGGSPTFWVLLVLVVGAAAVGVTARLRNTP
jgi:hypothetical protein